MKFNTRGMKTVIAAIAVGLFSFTDYAQEGENLVPNGSFESTGKKPKRLGKIESATGWVSPTGVRADLFVRGKVEEIGVPENVYGKEEAKDGENYAGIVGFSYGDKVARSYIMTKLDAPLKKGLKYCVKYYISLAEASKYASNNIATTFRKRPFGTDSKVAIIDEPSLSHFENEYKTHTARYNWTEVCGVYTSTGGEKYMTIGNFESNSDTKNERMKKDKNVRVSQVVAAYYYIDHVSVRLLDTEAGEKCDCAIDSGEEEYSSMIYQKAVAMPEDLSAAEQVEFQQVFFAFGKNKITSEGEASLNVIANYLNENPTSKIKVIGHSDASEEKMSLEKEALADLDSKRVGAVMKYLMAKGIAENRLIPVMKGSNEMNDKEISESDDDEMKAAKSRRVGFKPIQ